MNLTIVVAPPLRPAVEGRKTLDLGVPLGSDIGEVMHTLLTLYPKLQHYLPSDKNTQRQFLNLVPRGNVLYLFASQAEPPPLVRPARPR